MRLLINQKDSIFDHFVSAGHEGPNYSNFDEHVVWAQFSARVFRFCAFFLSGSRFGAGSEDSSKKLISWGYTRVSNVLPDLLSRRFDLRLCTSWVQPTSLREVTRRICCRREKDSQRIDSAFEKSESVQKRGRSALKIANQAQRKAEPP